MSLIYWDTMLFVYWLEGHPDFADRVGQIYGAMEKRGDVLCTSALTVGELLAGAKKRQSEELARTIHDLFDDAPVKVLPFAIGSVDRFAEVRAQYGVSAADAIHLAAAAHAGVDLFLTNDRRLRRAIVPGIRFIAGLDTDVI